MSGDVERNAKAAYPTLPTSLPLWRQLIDQGAITDDVLRHQYEGAGTEKDPYVVAWIKDDPRDPLLTPQWLKWTYALVMAFATLAVSMISSAYAGGIVNFMEAWDASDEVTLLGLSLYVFGFAIGPLFWAPLSEQYGRQILYWTTFGAFAAFNTGICGAQNIETVIILRFFAGSFGSSPLTNAGGVIADLFSAQQRGLALSIFAVAPFLAPTIGPIVGGFLGDSGGWRWLAGLMAIFSALMFVIGALVVPETYPPVLLRKRAARLTKITGRVYRSKPDIDRGNVTTAEIFRTALSRPWILLFREPIVLILTIYMAIIYGTLYLLFSAYPYVYQQQRHWNQGIGGLAFVGVAIGMLLALFYTIFIDHRYYAKVVEKNGGWAPPEARLPASMIGAVALPVGLFWFAWTNSPDLPWAASIAAGIPFGFGMVLLFLCVINYLIDAYTIFAASVLAANSILRSIFGAIFPLFTTQMYDKLGIHWASSIPAFLALACLPFPFLFYRYGEAIRLRCKYAAEADAFMKSLRDEGGPAAEVTIASHDISDEVHFEAVDKELEAGSSARISQSHLPAEAATRIVPLQISHSHNYEENPYDIDRIRTRESFRSERDNAS